MISGQFSKSSIGAFHSIGKPKVSISKIKKCFIAVSYTHLRAHETVLDLVCRLLLEKKKKTTTQTEHHIKLSLLKIHNRRNQNDQKRQKHNKVNN